MPILPPAMILLLRPFAPLFSRRVWAHVQVLLVGTLRAPAQRTVAAALRVVGLAQTPHFQRYHRPLNRASWSALAASRVLLRLLVATFLPDGPLVVGVDETLERRTGAKIAATGAIAMPSVPRTATSSKRPGCAGSRSCCSCQSRYAPAPPRQPHQNGRPRKKSARLPAFAVRAADPTTHWMPCTVMQWYGQRERTVEAASETALWYHTGLPAVVVRWVLIRATLKSASPPKPCSAPL